MCLFIKNKEINWNGSKCRIFWKQFSILTIKEGYHKLIGKYSSDYVYNREWNYPTSIKIEYTHNRTRINGGVIHVRINRLSNIYTRGLYPVICLKKDLVAVGSEDAAFKRIYIPHVIYENALIQSEINEELLKSILTDFRKTQKGLIS